MWWQHDQCSLQLLSIFQLWQYCVGGRLLPIWRRLCVTNLLWRLMLVLRRRTDTGAAGCVQHSCRCSPTHVLANGRRWRL